MTKFLIQRHYEDWGVEEIEAASEEEAKEIFLWIGLGDLDSAGSHGGFEYGEVVEAEDEAENDEDDDAEDTPTHVLPM